MVILSNLTRTSQPSRITKSIARLWMLLIINCVYRGSFVASRSGTHDRNKQSLVPALMSIDDLA